MRPRPRAPRAPSPRSTTRGTRYASAALAAAALAACDGARTAVEPSVAPPSDAAAPAVGAMTMTAYHAAYPTITSGTRAASRAATGTLRPSLSVAITDPTAFAAGATPAYTTFLDRAAFLAEGTPSATTGFEEFAPEGVAMPGDPYTIGGVTYRSGSNVVIAPPTFYVRSTTMFNNGWTPVAGTLDSAARYTMFGANLTVSSSDLSTSPVAVEITTNYATYAFQGVVVPAAIDGFSFFGITVTTPGEYITGFRFDSRGAGWAVGVDDVTVGRARQPNHPPQATLGGPYHGTEGETLALSAAASSDPDGDALAYAWDLDADGDYDDGSAATASRRFDDNGSYTVSVKVTDPSGEYTTAVAIVTVANAAPRARLSAPATVPEGTPIVLGMSDAADVDADAASLRFAFDCAGAGDYGAPGTANGATCATPDDGVRVLRGRVSDKDGGATEYAASVAVTNVAPTLGAVSAPTTDPVVSSSPVSVSASFTDPGSADTFVGEVRWDEGGAWEPAVIAGGTVTASKVLTAGVYTITLRVRDDDGGAGERTAPAYVVVYDPTAGFATSGGWIRYAGAACPTLCGGVGGRADFGFVSKDQKGGGTPTGRTRFVFHGGALAFASTSYEWLVVANSRAQFKGVGTLNGRSGYGFSVLTVDDAPDRVRVRIWDLATGDEGTPLFDSGDVPLDKVSGNGSVMVHNK